MSAVQQPIGNSSLVARGGGGSVRGRWGGGFGVAGTCPENVETRRSEKASGRVREARVERKSQGSVVIRVGWEGEIAGGGPAQTNSPVLLSSMELSRSRKRFQFSLDSSRLTSPGGGGSRMLSLPSQRNLDSVRSTMGSDGRPSMSPGIDSSIGASCTSSGLVEIANIARLLRAGGATSSPGSGWQPRWTSPSSPSLGTSSASRGARALGQQSRLPRRRSAAMLGTFTRIFFLLWRRLADLASKPRRCAGPGSGRAGGTASGSRATSLPFLATLAGSRGGGGCCCCCCCCCSSVRFDSSGRWQPRSELALLLPLSPVAVGPTSMSDEGFERSMSEVRDSSESTMRSRPWAEIAEGRGRAIGGGGAARFFL
jgi:hypothetical protein